MITVEELCNWLLENGYAEDRPGWGHVTGQDLAEALVKQYNITAKLYEPTEEEIANAAEWRRTNFPGISNE